MASKQMDVNTATLYGATLEHIYLPNNILYPDRLAQGHLITYHIHTQSDRIDKCFFTCDINSDATIYF